MGPSIGVNVYSLLDELCSVSVNAPILGHFLLSGMKILHLCGQIMMLLPGVTVFLIVMVGVKILFFFFHLRPIFLFDQIFFLFFDGKRLISFSMNFGLCF